jgi:energy-coupling factor transporter ATP-binding protein EcfA2
MIYNICGQPHSGKSTLANYLKRAIEIASPYRKVFIVEGDVLKKILNNDDFSENGRRANISQAYAIAKYLDTTEDFDVIIAIISPFKELRDELRLTSNTIEIYVHTTNVRGREKFHVPYFESPFLDYIDIDTTDVDELTSVNELLNKIQEIKKNYSKEIINKNR